MKLFVIDDCNTTWDQNMEFFLYGGIVVPEEEMRPLAEKILAIKETAGIPKERPLKWTNNRWQGNDPLDNGVHATLKEQVLDAVAASGIRIIVCLSPHRFYHAANGTRSDGTPNMGIDPATQKRTHEYGMNDVLSKFARFLREDDQFGMVLADEFSTGIKPHMDKHCFNKFANPASSMLERVVHPVIQVKNEDSHLHQVNDVVLGAIYFSLREMGHNFIPKIANNFWMLTPGDLGSIQGYGFNVYPEIPRTEWLKNSKQKLMDKFQRLSNHV